MKHTTTPADDSDALRRAVKTMTDIAEKLTIAFCAMEAAITQHFSACAASAEDQQLGHIIGRKRRSRRASGRLQRSRVADPCA